MGSVVCIVNIYPLYNDMLGASSVIQAVNNWVLIPNVNKYLHFFQGNDKEESGSVN